MLVLDFDGICKRWGPLPTYEIMGHVVYISQEGSAEVGYTPHYHFDGAAVQRLTERCAQVRLEKEAGDGEA